MKAWIGVDVSKDTLDVYFLPEAGKGRAKVFPNHERGHRALFHWVQGLAAASLDAHFCMEATGAYSTAIAVFLTEAGCVVSVVNPFRVKHAGMAQGAGNKTDAADARLIADYCKKENPLPWRLQTPEVRTLVALVRRLKSVSDHLQQENNRLLEPGLLPEVKKSVTITVRFLEKEEKRLKKQIDQHIDSHPGLKEDKDLLCGIPGVGDILALWIMAEMPDVSTFASAKQAAAYAGLNPREHRSGASVRKRTRLSKTGNSRLRRALYMPAIAACRYNPLVKALYDRLLERGKPKMAALGACMRKLLMIAFGVLKHRQPFNLNGLQTTR